MTKKKRKKCFVKAKFYDLGGEINGDEAIELNKDSIDIHSSETQVLSLLLHEHGFMGNKLAD